jgi:hypothetical protein
MIFFSGLSYEAKVLVMLMAVDLIVDFLIIRG